MNKRDFEPIHPGEILWEEFLQPMEITQEQLAKDINIPLPQIRKIVQGKQNISTDIALRLARFFNMEAQFWLNLQVRYDLICTQKNQTSGTYKTRSTSNAAFFLCRRVALSVSIFWLLYVGAILYGCPLTSQNI